jgi:hypothetical protein
MLINLKKAQGLAVCVLTAALAVAIFGVGAARLDAQAATASMQGTVTDASGAAIPDAAIQVRNVGTGATQNVTSNAQGRFVARISPWELTSCGSPRRAFRRWFARASR